MSELNLYIFDLEIYPNFFLFGGKFRGQNETKTFEISTRKNERSQLLSWLSYLQNSQAQMVGFNNVGFDYPILHELLNNVHTFTYETGYNACQQIINSQRFGGGFSNISVRDRIIPQIDLYKINHFDNPNRHTSLKALQCAMRSESVEDLPIEPGTHLTNEQMDQIIAYNIHDITETEKFLEKCMHLILMRKELLDNGVLSGDVLNFSDVKLGAEYLIKRIGRANCFHGSKPKQTIRDSVVFKEIILPKIAYRTESFSEILEWFKKQTIYVASKDPTPKHRAKLADLDFFFGVGGAHASVTAKYFESNATHVIRDVDVTGMYPSIAIANGFAPEHLGKAFSEAYVQLVKDRSHYKKGTMMNGTLKLGSNAAFGKGDDPFSCFYDPKFPKEITINGQLQILQLVELLWLIPSVNIIQANTDGVTVYLPRELSYLFDVWKREWEESTKLNLEVVDYERMWIRDVNNYFSISTSGKIKRKGAYQYPVEDSDYDGYWNKDYSMMVVPKLIEQVFTKGWDAEMTLKLMSDPFDFMLRYKTPSGADVFLGEQKMLKTVRYYVSTAGLPMKKVARPKGEMGAFKRKSKITDTEFEKVMSEIGPGVWDARIHTKNKGKYDMNETSIHAGRLVKCCNRASDFKWQDVDYEFYLNEVKKLEIK